MADQRRDLVQDERPEELEKMTGVSAAAARAWLAEQDAEDDADLPAEPLVVWPENWPVLRAWLALQSQWRFRRDGAPQGLRFDAVDVVLRRMRLGDEVFEHLIEMQDEALEAWNGNR